MFISSINQYFIVQNHHMKSELHFLRNYVTIYQDITESDDNKLLKVDYKEELQKSNSE